MSATRYLLGVGVLFALCCQSPAMAGVYTDPSGFSFTYPDGWEPVSGKDGAAAITDGGDDPKLATIREWIAKHKIELDRVKVFLLHVSDGASSENMNVNVVGEEVSVNQRMAEQIATEVKQRLAKMEMQITGFKARVQKFGAHEAIVFDYRCRIPGVDSPLRQRHILIPGGGNTYYITCTADADSFKGFSPTFGNIAASFKVPPPTAQHGFNWKLVSNNTFRGALVGAIAGGIVGLVMYLARKKRTSNKPPSEQ